MEGVWRGSDVGRTTSWYCLTYKGSKTTPKYSFLITWIRLYWPSVPRRTGTDPETHWRAGRVVLSTVLGELCNVVPRMPYL